MSNIITISDNKTLPTILELEDDCIIITQDTDNVTLTMGEAVLLAEHITDIHARYDINKLIDKILKLDPDNELALSVQSQAGCTLENLIELEKIHKALDLDDLLDDIESNASSGHDDLDGDDIESTVIRVLTDG